MKPNPPLRKQKDQVVIAAIALATRDSGKTLRYSEHQLVFAGQRPANDILWGTWGINSANAAQHIYGQFAARHNADHRNKTQVVPITLLMHYELVTPVKLNTILTYDLISATGYINIPRLKLSIKQHLKEMWLNRIHSEFGHHQYGMFADTTIEFIAQNHPTYAQDLLRGQQDIGEGHPVDISIVVHPVAPASALLEANAQPLPPLLLASVRKDPAKILSLQAQYRNDFIVEI